MQQIYLQKEATTAAAPPSMLELREASLLNRTHIQGLILFLKLNKYNIL